jgi:hypothetical protein
MSDKIEDLMRSNRRWKAIALAACGALALCVVYSLVVVNQRRVQAEDAMALARAAEAEARAAAAWK